MVHFPFEMAQQCRTTRQNIGRCPRCWRSGETRAVRARTVQARMRVWSVGVAARHTDLSGKKKGYWSRRRIVLCCWGTLSINSIHPLVWEWNASTVLEVVGYV
jgi:hypothetical protein